MRGGRVRAIFKRHMYTTLHSPPILFDMFIWPILDLLIWGLLTLFIQQQRVSLPIPVGFLVGGVLLWDLLFRSNLGIAIAFLDDAAYTRNAINILASPIQPGEYVAGTAVWALVKLAVGWGLMALMAWALFSFGILELGLGLLVFAPVLMLFGVALSMIVPGLVLRFGHSAEILAWGLAGVLLPLSAAFYPLNTLPDWARAVAAAFPAAHVFESMRAVLAGSPVPWDRLALAVGLDLVYLAAAMEFASWMFRIFRRRGHVTRHM